MDQLPSAGFVSMFTGVSSENNHTVGDIAEYGVCSDCGISISAPVLLDQTNIAAEQ